VSGPSGFLVTGGCGFIGSNLVRMLLREYPEDKVVNLDVLTYAGDAARFGGLKAAEDASRYELVKQDVCAVMRPDPQPRGGPDVLKVVPPGGFRGVFHLAAESHVDRSTVDAIDFVRTNVLGTQQVIDFVRKGCAKRLVHVSTDEVYGSLGPRGRFKETTPLHPNSPYAASKAAADLLVLAAVRTHGPKAVDAVITRCSNNYGPWQFPEKFIPLMITNAMEDKPLPVYGDGLQVRDWIHVEDHCRGLLAAFERGRAGSVYNFGGAAERENIAVVREIVRALNKPESLIRSVEDRPGHDRRYAIDWSKAEKDLGWKPRQEFEAGLAQTIQWYRKHVWWTAAVRSSARFKEYYERMYVKRILEGRPLPGAGPA